MLIAEDLLLLLLDDESGKMNNAVYLDNAIGGALLVELALGGHAVAVPREKMLGFTQESRIRTEGGPPSDPVLAEAYAVIAEKERTAQDLVVRLGRKRKDVLLERLESSGILRREEGRALGLFPRTRWPAVDGAHERDLRTRLGDALLRGVDPDERTTALVALLAALDLAHTVLDREDKSAKEVKRRAEEIAEGDWAAQGVQDAVQAAQIAVTVALTASVAATTTTSTH